MTPGTTFLRKPMAHACEAASTSETALEFGYTTDDQVWDVQCEERALLAAAVHSVREFAALARLHSRTCPACGGVPAVVNAA
jgi:hypothetical protein